MRSPSELPGPAEKNRPQINQAPYEGTPQKKTGPSEPRVSSIIQSPSPKGPIESSAGRASYPQESPRQGPQSPPGSRSPQAPENWQIQPGMFLPSRTARYQDFQDFPSQKEQKEAQVPGTMSVGPQQPTFTGAGSPTNTNSSQTIEYNVYYAKERDKGRLCKYSQYFYVYNLNLSELGHFKVMKLNSQQGPNGFYKKKEVPSNDNIAEDFVLCRSFIKDSQKEWEDFILQIKIFMNLKSPYLLQILDFDSQISGETNDSLYNVNIYYSYPLSEKISSSQAAPAAPSKSVASLVSFQSSNSKKVPGCSELITLETYLNRLKFSEGTLSTNSINNIIFDLSKAVSLLHQYAKGTRGQARVRPANILVLEEPAPSGEGLPEIVACRLVPLVEEEASFAQAARDRLISSYEFFLAPEVYNQAKTLLAYASFSSPIDEYKADAFAIGLVVLKCCLLEDFTKLYPKPTPGKGLSLFNTQALEAFIDRMWELYGDSNRDTCVLVERLLQVDARERVNASELLCIIEAMVKAANCEGRSYGGRYSCGSKTNSDNNQKNDNCSPIQLRLDLSHKRIDTEKNVPSQFEVEPPKTDKGPMTGAQLKLGTTSRGDRYQNQYEPDSQPPSTIRTARVKMPISMVRQSISARLQKVAKKDEWSKVDIRELEEPSNKNLKGALGATAVVNIMSGFGLASSPSPQLISLSKSSFSKSQKQGHTNSLNKDFSADSVDIEINRGSSQNQNSGQLCQIGTIQSSRDKQDQIPVSQFIGAVGSTPNLHLEKRTDQKPPQEPCSLIEGVKIVPSTLGMRKIETVGSLASQNSKNQPIKLQSIQFKPFIAPEEEYFGKLNNETKMALKDSLKVENITPIRPVSLDEPRGRSNGKEKQYPAQPGEVLKYFPDNESKVLQICDQISQEVEEIISESAFSSRRRTRRRKDSDTIDQLHFTNTSVDNLFAKQCAQSAYSSVNYEPKAKSLINSKMNRICFSQAFLENPEVQKASTSRIRILPKDLTQECQIKQTKTTLPSGISTMRETLVGQGPLLNQTLPVDYHSCKIQPNSCSVSPPPDRTPQSTIPSPFIRPCEEKRLKTPTEKKVLRPSESSKKPPLPQPNPPKMQNTTSQPILKDLSPIKPPGLNESIELKKQAPYIPEAQNNRKEKLMIKYKSISSYSNTMLNLTAEKKKNMKPSPIKINKEVPEVVYSAKKPITGYRSKKAQKNRSSTNKLAQIVSKSFYKPIMSRSSSKEHKNTSISPSKPPQLTESLDKRMRQFMALTPDVSADFFSKGPQTVDNSCSFLNMCPVKSKSPLPHVNFEENGSRELSAIRPGRLSKNQLNDSGSRDHPSVEPSPSLVDQTRLVKELSVDQNLSKEEPSVSKEDRSVREILAEQEWGKDISSLDKSQPEREKKSCSILIEDRPRHAIGKFKTNFDNSIPNISQNVVSNDTTSLRIIDRSEDKKDDKRVSQRSLVSPRFNNNPDVSIGSNSASSAVKRRDNIKSVRQIRPGAISSEPIVRNITSEPEVIGGLNRSKGSNESLNYIKIQDAHKELQEDEYNIKKEKENSIEEKPKIKKQLNSEANKIETKLFQNQPVKLLSRQKSLNQKDKSQENPYFNLLKIDENIQEQYESIDSENRGPSTYRRVDTFQSQNAKDPTTSFKAESPNEANSPDKSLSQKLSAKFCENSAASVVSHYLQLSQQPSPDHFNKEKEAPVKEFGLNPSKNSGSGRRSSEKAKASQEDQEYGIPQSQKLNAFIKTKHKTGDFENGYKRVETLESESDISISNHLNKASGTSLLLADNLKSKEEDGNGKGEEEKKNYESQDTDPEISRIKQDLKLKREKYALPSSENKTTKKVPPIVDLQTSIRQKLNELSEYFEVENSSERQPPPTVESRTMDLGTNRFMRQVTDDDSEVCPESPSLPIRSSANQPFTLPKPVNHSPARPSEREREVADEVFSTKSIRVQGMEAAAIQPPRSLSTQALSQTLDRHVPAPLSLSKDRFTRLDENKELEFVYDQYFFSD